MMAPRLIELHRVLKPTGSIYLHCDPTASHYLKILLDSIFESLSFRNEIVWNYSGWNKRLQYNFENRHDILLFYAKYNNNFNGYGIPWKDEEEYIKKRKQKVFLDENGRKYVLSDAGGGKRVHRYIDEAMKYGSPVDDVWYIDKLNNSSKERLGYPTQKPLALLERIIEASSNKGDVVLDPFCGCGTAVVAAQKLERRWIGIDITHLAINLIRTRLKDSFGKFAKFEVIGEPVSLPDAEQLAQNDPWQFQWWALGLVGARPVEQKKGADRGIDGRIYFMDDADEPARQIIISVKAGHVTASHIRDLLGVVEREKSAIGVLITMQEPTKPMRQDAASAGYYESPFMGKHYTRIQILTIADLLEGKRIEYPETANVTYKKAPQRRSRCNRRRFKKFTLNLSTN